MIEDCIDGCQPALARGRRGDYERRVTDAPSAWDGLSMTTYLWFPGQIRKSSRGIRALSRAADGDAEESIAVLFAGGFAPAVVDGGAAAVHAEPHFTLADAVTGTGIAAVT